MPARTIPIIPAGTQAFEVTLSGTPVRIVFRWMPETPTSAVSGWYVDLYDQAGEPLVLGRKATVSHSLWENRSYNLAIPDGDLYVVDLTGEGLEAGRDAFTDGTHALVWVES